MKYINRGKCIFCGKGEKETTFNEKPHTIPRSLGGNHIGFDICDKCNHYFGEPDKAVKPSISVENSVKEIIGITKKLLYEDDIPKLKSIYFSYFASTHIIRLREKFRLDRPFQHLFANQFKRGLYEMFLQEYHYYTQDGLNSEFDEIRRYARYNIGDIPVYYLQSNGPILVQDVNVSPSFGFNGDSLDEIHTYGFYTLYFYSHWFILEVTPRARLCRENRIRLICKQLGVGNFVFYDIKELKYINDVDFTLRCLNDENK